MTYTQLLEKIGQSDFDDAVLQFCNNHAPMTLTEEQWQTLWDNATHNSAAELAVEQKLSALRKK